MKKGFVFIICTALISSVSVFLSKFAIQAVGNSHVFTTEKNIIVALVLSIAVLTPFLYKKLKVLKKNEWLKLILIGIIGGSVPFLLFFKAVSVTSSVNAAFIHKTLFVWVSLLAIWFLKEKISRWQYFGLVIILIGNFFLLGFKVTSFGYGEFLALLATLFWAIEFIIAKKVLKTVDPIIVAWARMFFGSIVLIGFVAYIGKVGMLLNITAVQFGWIVLTSILLLGYVLTWYRGLKYLPAGVAASILVIASPLTTLWNNLFIQHSYTGYQTIGSVVIIAGALLTVYFVKNYPVVTEKKYGEQRL